MEHLCGKNGISRMPLFHVSSSFRRGMGAPEDARIYLRCYRGLQKEICFAMCVNIIDGKTKRSCLSV